MTAMSTKSIGKPVSRVDGPAKVTGAAKYAAEFNVPNLAHGFVVNSKIAKGRIKKVDRTAALAVLDEFAEWAAEPRYRDLARGMEGVEQLRPAALVAIKPPGLDQLGAGIFVFGRHRSFSCARSAPRIALARPARGDGPYLPEY